MRAEAAAREPGLQGACVGRLWAWQRGGGRAGDAAEREARARALARGVSEEDALARVGGAARADAAARQRVFHLHDGPPYANGPPHVGHALNRVAKDAVNRYRLLRGDRVAYVPGWDCHGLPIEAKAVAGLAPGAPAEAVRREARRVAEAAADAQAAAFRRWGVLAGWDDPGGTYRTMDPRYEAAQLRVLLDLFRAGRVHRGRRPVHWSPSSRTALADAELEYPAAGRTSLAAYVALPSASEDPLAPAALVWTTTPWTLPAHRAVAVHPELAYVHVVASGGRRLVVGAEQLRGGALAQVLGGEAWREDGPAFPGSALAGARWRRPLETPGAWSPTVMAPGLVRGGDTGTGLVHLAWQHGVEDHEAVRAAAAAGVAGLEGWEEDAEVVDAAGRFVLKGEGGGGWRARLDGVEVLAGGSEAVLACLAPGAVVHAHPHMHRWPHDWRTGGPTLVRATPQWFCRVDAGAAAAALEGDGGGGGVAFVPESGAARMRSTLGARGAEWCISRQRPWGVPIPAMHARDGSGRTLMDEALLARAAEVVAAHPRGSDAWWEVGEEAWLRGRPDGADPEAWVKGTDTLDVWFDSGSSWRAVSRGEGGYGGDAGGLGGPGFPADLVIEGNDQHRGWFQSSLLTSVACTGAAPYRQVMTHGFVTDGAGRKMSKSEGNVVDPRDIVEGSAARGWPAYGADVLRVWVAQSNLTGSSVGCTHANVEAASAALRAARNTLRFLLGALDGFDAAAHAVPLDALRPLDAHLLHARLVPLRHAVQRRMDALDLAGAFHALTTFAERDVSALYLPAAKRRLYCSPRASAERRSAQTVLFHTLHVLVAAAAPFAPHTVEDVFQHMPDGVKADRAHFSAFQAGWMHALDAALDAGRGTQPSAQDDVTHALVGGLLESSRWADLVSGAYAAGMLDGKAQERRLDKARVTLYVQGGGEGWGRNDGLRAPLAALEANLDLAELLGAAEAHAAVVSAGEAEGVGRWAAFLTSQAGRDAHGRVHVMGGGAGAEGPPPPDLAACDALAETRLELVHPRTGERVPVVAVVQPSHNARCSRCRLYTLSPGSDAVPDSLCARCAAECAKTPPTHGE